MPKNELIYSFDLGSGSIGICARSGKKVLYLDSLLIDSEFASVKEAAARRRQIRTRIAHKEREKWWNEQAVKSGIEVLSTAQPTKENPTLKTDKRILTEFLPKDSKDKTIYSSHLLRIALLQGVRLEGWQVYKAIHSAIQRRGYDANLPWGSGTDNSDEKDNSESSNIYNEKLKEFFGDKEKYHYPCYYEAYVQGIWSTENPKDLSGRLSENPSPARNKDNKPAQEKCFPSRQLVEKELKALLASAAQFFPKLKGKEDFILYGPAEKAYASYNKDDKYTQYRGTNWDWKGLLGQKVPRFDNRIIAKCRLIPRLNVCKAGKQVNKEVSFLLNLKNMRYSKDNTTSMALTPVQINDIFKVYTQYIESEKEKEQNKKSGVKIQNKRAGKSNPFTKTFWKNYVRDTLGSEINVGQQEITKPKDGGRSSFCKPALHILHGLILSGKKPHDYYKELVAANKNTDINKGLVKDDYKFLLNMPNDWNSISIQDTREDDKKLSQKDAKDKIKDIISGVSNRIVRHRLIMLVKQLEKLSDKLKREYGDPDKVIFEIAREDFIGEKKKNEYISSQNANKKENEAAVKKLKDMGIAVNSQNILKIRLGNQQRWKDIYDTSEKRDLIPQYIQKYEIDHIIPQKLGGSDSFVNFILTKNALNQAKGRRTPYQWLQTSSNWQTYLSNVEAFSKFASPKKIELLTSDKAIELEKRKTDLQATSYLEKLAQQITGLYFGFGINTKDDKKRILFYTGGETANVRSKLDLNEILYSSKEEYEKAKQSNLKEKNRKNKKHHALDALVLSLLPEIKTKAKVVEEKPEYFNKEYCKKEISKVIPETIKQITPKPRQTIYALRCRIEEDGEKHYYFVSRFNSNLSLFTKIADAKEESKKIFDLKIQKDFQEKLKENGLTQESWEKWLNKYSGYGKRIKQIAMIDSKSFDEKDVFNSDGTKKEIIDKYGDKGVMRGQWIRGEESHQGQIVYKEQNKWNVEPIYVFESVYNKLKEYKNKYDKVKFFKSGQLVVLKEDCNDIKSGVYKLRTVKSSGRCKIESVDTQKEIEKNIAIFIEQYGMEVYKKQ
ncbi:MAG: hypothetical protein FWD54_05995 [Endomicrobia bacterium]|nr:hypothetical protein [Endomicrobiia bacterium]